MTWIDDHKGAGPWPFVPQADKPHYNEGNLISNKNNPVWEMDFTGEPVTPTHSPCGYWHNCPVSKPASSCNEACIGFTTQQMSVNQSQTLEVVNPVGGQTYLWSIISGGGSLSLSSGLSIYYTAPSSNENCEANPEITLSIGDLVCDSLLIAINAAEGIAYTIVTTECQPHGGTCDNPVCADWCTSKWCFCIDNYGCNNECIVGTALCSGGYHESQCLTYLTGAGGLGAITDTRTPAMIIAGCCPAELL